MKNTNIACLVIFLTSAFLGSTIKASHITDKDIALKKNEGEIGGVYSDYLFGSTKDKDLKTITFKYRLVNGTDRRANMEYKSALLGGLDVEAKHHFPITSVFFLDMTKPSKFANLDMEFSATSLLGSGAYDAAVYRAGDKPIKLMNTPAFVPRWRVFEISLKEFAKVPKTVVGQIRTVIGEVIELYSVLTSSPSAPLKPRLTYKAVNKGKQNFYIQWRSATTPDFRSGLISVLPPGRNIVMEEVDVQGEVLYIVNDLVVFNTKSPNNLPREKLSSLKTDVSYTVRLNEIGAEIKAPNSFLLAPAIVPQDRLR